MLGVARYRLEGNFMPFFNLRDDKGWGNGEFDVHCDPLGSPGTPFVGRNRMESKFELLRLPGLKIGDEQHTTPALGRKGS